MPPGVIDFDGRRIFAIEMRQAILERLGNNNVLVGFHVASTLTALCLPLSACRVVNLGAKEVYQLFCFNVSDAFRVEDAMCGAPLQLHQSANPSWLLW